MACIEARPATAGSTFRKNRRAPLRGMTPAGHLTLAKITCSEIGMELGPDVLLLSRDPQRLLAPAAGCKRPHRHAYRPPHLCY